MATLGSVWAYPIMSSCIIPRTAMPLFAYSLATSELPRRPTSSAAYQWNSRSKSWGTKSVSRSTLSTSTKAMDPEASSSAPGALPVGIANAVLSWWAPRMTLSGLPGLAAEMRSTVEV
eukprot:Rmarinus@m.16752